jgi:tripartite-type tricarboxylate transporter receptor subunit TctC
MIRRLLTALPIAMGLVCALFPSLSAAQAFPNKPVRIIVPYPAGGPVDVLGRALGQRLTDVWQQSVLIENRAGGSEIIAAELVAKSPADGYTLLLATDASYSLNQFLFSKLPYDPVKDFSPIMRVVSVNMALAVGNANPAKTLQEFVEFAGKNPGKITYASSGVGGAQHLAAAWLANLAKVDMHHVPYKGLAPALADIMGGQIDSVFGALSVIQPLVTGGKIKALAVSGAQRAKVLPDTPTFAELGYKDFAASFYMGLAAPAKTPQAIIDKIGNEARTILQSAAFREKNMDPFAFETVADTPAQFSAWLAKDRERQAWLVKISGAKVD